MWWLQFEGDKIIEQIKDLATCDVVMSYIAHNDVHNTLQRYQYVCGTIPCTFKTSNKEIILILYKITVVPMFLYGYPQSLPTSFSIIYFTACVMIW